MQKSLVLLCAGLIVVFSGAQTYAGNGHGGAKGRKECLARCNNDFKLCKDDAKSSKEKEKCAVTQHFCITRC